MKKWATQVDMQRRVWKDQARSSNSTTHSKPSDTQFNYMRDQVLENPYQENDDEGDDEDVDTVVPGYPGPQDSYGRSSSIPPRSRSMTGDSGPPVNEGDPRVPPPRFPMGYPAQPQLTLRTQQLAASAGQQDSYFSPTADSPMSTFSTARTSSSSAGTFPFPRQAPPNGWHDENNRYTAPAPARSHMSREGSMGPGGYPNGRAMQRPSLPPNAGSNMLAQGRLRAASSPDIHNANAAGRRLPNGQQAPPVPDVPPFPTHYAYNAAIVNRSQSNSPSGMPPRAATQSPCHSTRPFGAAANCCRTSKRGIPRRSSSSGAVARPNRSDYDSSFFL